MSKLTKEDFNVLLEAVEVWEDKDAVSEMASDLIFGMLKGKLGPIPPDLAREKERKRAQAQLDKVTRKERSIALRAKLLSLRDSLVADEF